MTNPDTKEEFVCEILDMSDNRIDKIKLPGDVCVYCDELKWGTTYDAEFLDNCCVPHETPQTNTQKE